MEFNLHALLDNCGVDYKNKGDELLIRCLSPHHQDTSPSMNISTDDPHLFNCFSCGYKGNKYSLVKVLTGRSYYEYTGTQGSDKSSAFQQSLKRAKFAKIASKLVDIKLEGDLLALEGESLKYATKRNLTKEFISYYDVTYCRSIKVNGTPYKNRLCVPLKFNKKTVNLEGRTYIGDKPKVMYAKHGSTNFLFDYDRLDREEYLFVVEGLMDLPQLFNLGYRNITAVFGSNLTKNQLKQLSEFKKIILIPDNDEAGMAMIKQLDDYLEDKDFEIVFLPKTTNDVGASSLIDLKESINRRVSSTVFFVEELGIFTDNKKLKIEGRN